MKKRIWEKTRHKNEKESTSMRGKKKSDSVKVKHNVFNSDPEKFPLMETFNK